MNLKIRVIRNTIIVTNFCILIWNVDLNHVLYSNTIFKHFAKHAMTWWFLYKYRRYYRWNPAVHNLWVLHGHRLKWTYISLDDSSIFYTLNDGAIDTTKINFLLITFLIFQFKYLQYTRLIKKWFSNSWIKAKLY